MTFRARPFASRFDGLRVTCKERPFASRFDGLRVTCRERPFDWLRVALSTAPRFGLPREVRQEYAGYGLAAASGQCHPPMIEQTFCWSMSQWQRAAQPRFLSDGRACLPVEECAMGPA